MKRRFKVLVSIAVAMLFLLNIMQINAQEKETNNTSDATTEVESFSLLNETEFNYEEKLVSEGRIKYDVISPYEFTTLNKLPSSDEMYAIAYEQYPELENMSEDTYYLNFISGSSKKHTRTTQAEMLQPNPYGSTSFPINGGTSIKVWKAPSSVSFKNLSGNEYGLTFATYDNKVAYCLEAETYHGGGTLSSDPLSVALNPTTNKTVAKWARSAEYYQSVDTNYWGEYLGVAQDKIWNVMGSTNNGSTVSSTYYDRVVDYKNALDNPSVVTTNLPNEMYVGQSYEITVNYGKVYNHIQKLSDNFDIKLSSNAINSNKLDLRAVYLVTPKTHGSFDIRFLSEPIGSIFSANYIYGSNQNLFVGRALDPSWNTFNTQIIGEVEVGAIKVDSENNPIANVEIEFSTTEDFTTNLQKAATDETGEINAIKFQIDGSSTELEIFAREVSAPPQFVLDDTVVSKVIKAGEIGTFEFTNNYRTLEIKKVDEDGNNLAGAELVIKDEQDEIVFEWTSTDKSKTVILDYGKYTYCETKAPSKYELNTECKEIIVDTQGEIQYKEIINYEKEDSLVATGFANKYLAISLVVLFISISLYYALGKRNEKKEEA